MILLGLHPAALKLRKALAGKPVEDSLVNFKERVMQRAVRADAAPVRTKRTHHHLVGALEDLDHIQQGYLPRRAG